METETLTYFASPERSDYDVLLRQKSVFENLPQLAFFLNTVPTIYLILNDNRQIVFANKTALDALGYKSVDDLIGMRPGEAINCMHSGELPSGCGTSEACQQCGAVNAILNGLKNISDVRECRITTEESKDFFDFRVWTNPYNIGDEKFVIFSLADISSEKRRSALERIFFHDVLNTAGGIRGISELINSYPEEVDEFKEILFNTSNQLINEIQAQRDLQNAENNELAVYIVPLNSIKILGFLSGIYSMHEVAKNKKIAISKSTDNIDFESDEPLLMRVIGNMTKNALEACDDMQTVTLDCKLSDDKVIFSIHNPKFMPREIQLQVFQRSFSTKGSGRGLGTYSMKLITEKYLNGKVYFTSDIENGTTFFAEYPVKFPKIT